MFGSRSYFADVRSCDCNSAVAEEKPKNSASMYSLTSGIRLYRMSLSRYCLYLSSQASNGVFKWWSPDLTLLLISSPPGTSINDGEPCWTDT